MSHPESSRTITADTLRERLGLRDPKVFELEQRWKRASVRLSHGDITRQEVLARGTGRTTEMLLQGLAHVASTGEHVLFLTFCRDSARMLERRAREYAEQLGIDPRRITARSSRECPTPSGLLPRQVLTDHFVLTGI